MGNDLSIPFITPIREDGDVCYVASKISLSKHLDLRIKSKWDDEQFWILMPYMLQDEDN